MEPVKRVEGRGCVLQGDDIDTDRIIPARYLRCVTFDGLGEHAFEDDRKQAKGRHPLDDRRFSGAAILIVGRNFGCGSSREHAPQSLLRFGFRAFVGESFAEIFSGNCTALGLPCTTLSPDALEALRESVELEPSQELVLDVEAGTITSHAGSISLTIAEAAQRQLVEGTWNAMHVLLEADQAIEATADRLPYVGGFAG